MAGELTLDYQKDAIPNPIPLVGCKKLRRNGSLASWNYLENSLLLLGNLLLAFCLMRFAAPGGIYPAGVALLFACQRQQFGNKLALLCGAVIGSFTIQEPVTGLFLSSAIVVWYGAVGLLSKRRTSLKPLTSFTLWAVLRIGIVACTGPNLFYYGLVAVELVCTYLLAVLFQRGLAFLENPMRTYSKISLTALAMMLLLAVGGIGSEPAFSVNFQELAAVVLVLTVGYLGGGGVGAVMGISVAVIIGIPTDAMIALIAMYGLSGLFGGVLKELGRWGTIAGSSCGLFLAMGQLHENILGNPQLLPWGMGIMAFLLIPRRCLSQISSYFPNQVSENYSRDERQKLREVVMSRLDDLAAIFEELAKSFHQTEVAAVDNEQKVDLYSLLDRVCTKNCQQCTGYGVCWGENFYSTYREIFDLLALAELYGEVKTEQLKGKLAKTCFQQFKLITTINHLFESCQNEYQWRRKLEEGKYFLANQLQGMADIICNLTQEIANDTSFRSEVEDHLKHSFQRLGMGIKEVGVTSIGEERLEVKVRQRSCGRKRECYCLAAPLISRLLGTEYSVWERKCHLENGQCTYALSPVRQYHVKTTVCKLAKSGTESGDTSALRELKDGHFVAIVSDGMGHGDKASEESKTTVAILEKLLESGIDRDFAVNMVNSVLLLRSPDESFATVDLALLDLFDGRAEFVKIGAASSYIKRGREVISIKSTSLPAGILNTVDIERTEFHLQPGDMIILATDGVVDSKPNQAGKEDWMVRALRQVEVVGPEALGEYLLSLAKINQDGVPKDDMTVVVLQFNLNEPVLQ